MTPKPKLMPFSETAAIVLILFAAAVLRFWDMDRTSLWLDEGASFYQSNRTFLSMLAATAQDNYPPLHNIILWFTIKFVGTSEAALRLPSATMGVMAVYGIYRVGSIVGPRGVGVGAAALLAVLPLHVWHSVEARMYALLTLTAICFMWATLVHWRKPSLRSTLVLALSTLALLMSHVYGSLAVASVNGYLLLQTWSTKRLRDHPTVLWLTSQAAAVIFFVPWIALLARRTLRVSASGFWIPYPDAAFIERQLTSLLGIFPLVVLSFLGLYYLSRLLADFRRRDRTVSDYSISLETGLLLALLLGPITIGYLASILAVPILLNRYLLVSVPAALLLLSRAALGLPLPTLVRVSVLVALILSLVPASLQRANNYQGERHDLRSVAAFMLRYRREGDLLTHVGPGLQVIQYYNVPLRGVVPAQPVDNFAEAMTGTGRIWIVFTQDGLRTREQTLKNYEQAGFERKLEADYHASAVVMLETDPPSSN